MANELTEKEQQYLKALMGNRTREEAAKELGITSRGLRDFLVEHPVVIAALQEQRKDAIREVSHELSQDVSAALKRLREIVQDSEVSDADAMSAIRATLDNLVRYHHIDALQDDIQQIKAVLKEKGLTK